MQFTLIDKYTYKLSTIDILTQTTVTCDHDFALYTQFTHSNFFYYGFLIIKCNLGISRCITTLTIHQPLAQDLW